MLFHDAGDNEKLLQNMTTTCYKCLWIVDGILLYTVVMYRAVLKINIVFNADTRINNNRFNVLLKFPRILVLSFYTTFVRTDTDHTMHVSWYSLQTL